MTYYQLLSVERGDLAITQVNIYQSTLHILFFMVEVHFSEEVMTSVT